MKSIIFFLLLLNTCFAQVIQTEVKCQICGKSIYKMEKQQLPSFYSDNNGIILRGESDFYIFPIPDSISCTTIKFCVETGDICQECKSEYLIERQLQSQWDEWLKRAIKGHINTREKYDYKRKKAELLQIQNQIKELKLKEDKLLK